MASHLVTAQPGRATLADQSRLNRQRRIALALHRRRSRWIALTGVMDVADILNTEIGAPIRERVPTRVQRLRDARRRFGI